MNVRRGPMNHHESEEQRRLYKELRERIRQLRLEELFEEPSSYEDEIDDDDHMW